MEFTLFYLVVMIFQLLHYTCYTEANSIIAEPCLYPENYNRATATMCSKSSAIEDDKDGVFVHDTVTLRIVTQTDNCTCLVSIDNQKEDELLIFKTQGGAQYTDQCGLVIDIEYVKSQNKAQLVTCSTISDGVQLSKGSKLRLTSRKIEGNFSKGYSLTIIRSKNKAQLHKTTLRLICLNSTTTGGGPNVKSDKVCNEERNRTLSEEGPVVLYIAIGLGSLAFIVLLFVITIVIAKRKKSTFLLRDKDKTKQSKSSCQNVQSEPDDELQDNILYVPTEGYADGKTNNEGNMVTPKEITLDVEGNYITMSFEETANARDKKNTVVNNTTETAHSKADSSVDASVDINTETRDEKHQSEEPEEATNPGNVYAVVNKTSKHSTWKENKASSVTSIICKTEHPPSFEDHDNWSKDKSKSDNAHANQRKIRYHSGVEGDYSSIDFDEEKSDNDVTKSVINNGNDTIRAIENQKLKEGDDIERQEEQKPYIDVLLNQPTVVDREEPSNKHCDSDHVYSVVNKPFKKEQ